MNLIPRASFVFLAFLLCTPLFGENWPAWRGPTGQGHCNEKNVPLTWSETKNVKWKVPLEYQGNSTPVVWGDRVFLTQANKGGTQRSLLCLSRSDGKLLWRRDVAYEEPERNWNANWYTNASPAVDGQRVVVSFGSAGVYCYDLNGAELWKRTDLGHWEHPFGNAASPVLYHDTVLLWCGPNKDKGRNFLLAVGKKDGKTIWEHEEKYGSWVTPLIVKIQERDQILLATGTDQKKLDEPPDNYLMGLDPKTGQKWWTCRGVNSYAYASPLYGNGVAVAMSGFMGSAIAVKVGGQGDITSSRLWRHPKNKQRVGSGVLVGNHIYHVEDNGQPRCYDLMSGDEVWNADKAGNGTWGSLVYADGRVYCLMKNAETVVFKASPQYEVLARNPLGQRAKSNSSIAISDGQIFIRTFKHLWCIGE